MKQPTVTIVTSTSFGAPTMQKYRNILLNTVTALSLVLCLAACVGWVGSRDGIYFCSQHWTVHGSSVTEVERWFFWTGGNVGTAHRATTRIVEALEIPSNTYLAAHPTFDWTMHGRAWDSTHWEMGSSLTAPRIHGVERWGPHGWPIPLGVYREHTIPAFLPPLALALLPLYRAYRLRIRQWPNWKSFLLAYVMASYGLFGVILLLPTPAGYTPIFWIICAVAPLGAPFLLVITALESEFGVDLFLGWVIYVILFVTILMAVHRWNQRITKMHILHPTG